MRRKGDINKIQHEKKRCEICNALYWRRHKCERIMPKIPITPEDPALINPEDFLKEI